MSSASSIVVGSVVGGYRIEEKIGEGGMAVVYRATQEDLGRPAALKIIKPDLAADATFRARFERESRVTSAVDHPNVIPIYAEGDDNGIAFLAMQLVDGIDLKTLIAREGALEPRRAARIVAQAAAGLDAAHAVGLVHHDVKPGNILVTGDDHIYLTDFGLAKYGPARDPLTRPGQALGSMDYMAPEQIRGEAVDARADQYALGAVLYEALTGEPPYGDEKGMRILWAHLQDDPPLPSAKSPDLPPALDQVVARALAKKPDDRYPSAGDLGEAALAAVAGAPLPRPAPSPAPALGAAAPRPADGTVQPIEAGVEVAPRRPIRFQLKPGFSYIHQPLASEEQVIPLLGNDDVVDSLTERIAHSAGGSFLVTGFRGVGKTTVIARALERLAADSEGAPRVLPVFLNVARPRTTEELLFDVIRRLFETLVDAEVLDRLAPEIQRQLILAYTRTSMSFKETRGNSVERARGIGIGAAAPLVEALSAKLDFSKKTSNSLATEASFLAYSDADVEHDFVRILSLFRRVQEPDDRARRGWRQMLGGASLDDSAPAWDGKVVVVIDELDKLTAREDGMRCIEDLLNGLKNLLTTRGVHFLFVAGPDLHDVALRESNRGNSVYESVFGWHMYVPCIWSGTGRLLDSVVADIPERHRHYLDSLRDYLEFKARGVPRLLLMEFNSFVEWDGDDGFLTVRPWDLARLEFYAELERTLERFLHQGARAPVFSVAIDDDRWRVGAYYVTDWILRNRSTFTVDDVVGSDRGLTIDPMLVLSASKVERLLEHLVEHEVLERVRGNAADETYFGDVPQAQTPVYRLAEDRVAKLDSFMRINERERAQLVPGPEGSHEEPASAQPWADTDPDVAVVMDRYLLRKEIDRGGMGRVYRAYDRLAGREVAVKLLESSAFYGDERLRARFLRKGELAKSLSHPNIAATHDVFSEDDGRLGIVMDFIEGTALGAVLGRTPMSPADAVGITRQLLDAIEYLDANGVVRLDLKPSSILLDSALRPVIVDLGLAKSTSEEGEARHATMAEGVVVGTPAYAAPEQLAGMPVDIRGDLYSIALLLFEMLAGRPAREGDEPLQIMMNAVNEDVDMTGLEVSPELHEVLACALAREPDGRYSSPREMRAALDATPEAGPSEPRAHAA